MTAVLADLQAKPALVPTIDSWSQYPGTPVGSHFPRKGWVLDAHSAVVCEGGRSLGDHCGQLCHPIPPPGQVRSDRQAQAHGPRAVSAQDRLLEPHYFVLGLPVRNKQSSGL